MADNWQDLHIANWMVTHRPGNARHPARKKQVMSADNPEDLQLSLKSCLCMENMQDCMNHRVKWITWRLVEVVKGTQELGENRR